jgi:hypothetical protein
MLLLQDLPFDGGDFRIFFDAFVHGLASPLFFRPSVWKSLLIILKNRVKGCFSVA